MKKLLAHYKNGNYQVALFHDGTKLRFNKEKELKPEFPENIDLKISNRCGIGCSFCHEASTKNGKFADLVDYKTFFDSLQPGTELAVGGGGLSFLPGEAFNAMTGQFIHLTVVQKVIVNITLNQLELQNSDFFKYIAGQLLSRNPIAFYGVGISYVHKGDNRFEQLAGMSRTVVHTIAGILTKDDLDYLSTLNTKILILGYKNFRRGEKYYNQHSDTIKQNIEFLKNHIKDYIGKFKTISFDCLAVEQLDLKNQMDEDKWNLSYMGNDGKFTMYVDLVSGTYAKSSTVPEDERLKLTTQSTVKEIFSNIQNNN